MSMKNKNSRPGKQIKKEAPKHSVDLKDNQVNIIGENLQLVKHLEKQGELLNQEYQKAQKTANQNIALILESAGYDVSKVKGANIDFDNKKITFEL